jgi:hypothetical protein
MTGVPHLLHLEFIPGNLLLLRRLFRKLRREPLNLLTSDGLNFESESTLTLEASPES